MQVSRGLDGVGVTFDDERLVANAGLIVPATLAEHLGLRELIEQRVDLGDAPGRANVGHKAMTVIHAVLAGADSIDDCEVLRAGATSAVLGHAVAAPSTVGTFLRSFSWPDARQLDTVGAQMLSRAWAAGGGPEATDAPMTIDVDSSVHETYGLRKEGATRFSYTKVRGYHPLYATLAETGEVLHARLRGGNSHTARGAVSFLAETFARVRAAGANGPIDLRADSGFYSKKVVDACKKAGVRFSITVKLYKGLLAAISKIPEESWTSIPYWLEDGADVAEIPWQAFGPGDKGVACRLVVRRVKPTPGSQLALIATYSYHAFITDREGTPVALDAHHRRHAVVENAIRDLKYGVGLNHLPSGRFGANAAWLALNAMAHNLSRWSARIGGIDTDDPGGGAADAELTDTAETEPPGAGGDQDRPGRQTTRKSFVATDTIRRRHLAVPGRLAGSARKLTLHLPARWPWAEAFVDMLDAIRAVKLLT